MNHLGAMYADGRGVPKDDAQAVRLYQDAAYLCEPEAMLNLGVMYANGEGMEEDYAAAVQWYRKAARLGHEAA